MAYKDQFGDKKVTAKDIKKLLQKVNDLQSEIYNLSSDLEDRKKDFSDWAIGANYKTASEFVHSAGFEFDESRNFLEKAIFILTGKRL